ncbi:Uncharacterised protein [uncultured Comamonas sp.]|nr:Uncharacterised protein [uncultured Comamonas sp.]
MSLSVSSSVDAAATQKITGLQGPWRRVVFVGLYELIAIFCASGLFMLIGQQPGESGAMAIAASVIAMTWNVTFNHWFERWELRQTVKGRSLKRRIAHALGFEGGLGAILVPVMAWWFGITLWEATVMEAGMLAFFLVYTYVFNWSFDRIFGLPASAQVQAGSAAAQ